MNEHISLGIHVSQVGVTHITRDTCFPGGGTHITKDTCFPGEGTHITRKMCFPGGGTHITRDTCFPGRGTYITMVMCFILRDMCFLFREHMLLGICVFHVGERISVGIRRVVIKSQGPGIFPGY